MSEDDPGSGHTDSGVTGDPDGGDRDTDATVDPEGAAEDHPGSDAPTDVTVTPVGDRAMAGGSSDGGLLGPVRRFWNAEEGASALVRDLLSSALMVLLVAGILFGLSGVWPPMVAIKSGSMNPHMYKGDLVFVTEGERFAGEGAVADTGIVTHQAASETGYSKFGAPGDVIVYLPDNRTDRDPIIHRAMFYVEEGENWYDRANESYVRADSCNELQNCPAREAGFITKGDNPQSNRYYDQATGMSRPVQPEWVKAKAMVRIPALGWIRLKWAEVQRGTASAAAALLLVGGRNLWRRRRAA